MRERNPITIVRHIAWEVFGSIGALVGAVLDPEGNMVSGVPFEPTASGSCIKRTVEDDYLRESKARTQKTHAERLE